MIKNYLKTTFRALWKNKGYSLLNIGGLAIGIACTGLIFLWVEDELTYNHYFSNRDNLYKIKDRQTYDGNTFTFDATPGPLAAGINAEIPGIKNTARTTWGDNTLFSLKDKSLYEQGLYADPAFLTMFQLQFVQGNAATAFYQLHSLVITEKMAERFFGPDSYQDNLIGKSLKVDNKEDYIITGVIKDLPENVSFKFDWLAPFKIFEDQNKWLQSWGNNGLVTYVETEPKTKADEINKKLYDYVATKQQGATAKMSIYPMNRWRMYDNFDNGKEVPGRIKYVHLFSLIAWIILIIACINFMNLSTARSEQRAKEVGVKKVLGAGKRKLIVQFIGESVFTSVIAALLAIGFIYLSMPAFNNLVEKQLSVNLAEPFHIMALLAIAITCGLIAGSYPAFYLSSFKPVYVLKGIKIKNSGSAGIIRKGLVILQFSISVILIISTIIIYQQISHVKDRDLGYNKNGLLYMYMQGTMKQHFNAIKNDLETTGLIQNAAISNNQILELGSNTGDFTWKGKQPDKQVLITIQGVSPEYLSTMDMRLKEGRNFYPDVKSDSNNIIINESLAKIINKKNILGSTISQDSARYTIVGVIKDFVYNDMYAQAAPLIIFADTSNCNVLNIRIKTGVQVPAAIAIIETVIKNNNPGYPFDYSFVDKQFDKLFKTETLIGKLAGVFSVLAIFISCLGLFGLAAYTAERRTKEIGIRKVLGASTQGLAGLLSKEFLVLVAILTVSFQAIKVAIANPVDSLRTE